MADAAPTKIPPTRRPWYHPLPLAKRIAFSALIVYSSACVYLFCIQTRLIYPESSHPLPAETADRQAKSVGLIAWDRPTPGATSPQGYVQPTFANPSARGTIVVFHGNGGWCANRVHYLEAFSRRGFRTFLYEYPGYGGRPGRPSEATIVPDAQALVRSLDQAGFGPVYLWGESLGAGVAAAVCGDSTLPVHGLTLLTPWDNLPNVGLSIYPYIPIRLLMVDRYDSIANLQHFPHPICVIRSENDEVIPPRLTLNLISHLPETTRVIVQPGCGHNDWPNSPELSWWDDALNFIAPQSDTNSK